MGKDALSSTMSMKRPAYPRLRTEVTRSIENKEPEENPLARLDSSGSSKRSTSSTALMQKAANATRATYLLRGTKDKALFGKVETPISFAFPLGTFIEVCGLVFHGRTLHAEARASASRSRRRPSGSLRTLCPPEGRGRLSSSP